MGQEKAVLGLCRRTVMCHYLSNMARTSALCAFSLCIQSQCVITMPLHSYIVLTMVATRDLDSLCTIFGSGLFFWRPDCEG